MSTSFARACAVPPTRWKRARASATGIQISITTDTGITSPVRSVVFV
jgi:hypothetical protein